MKCPFFSAMFLFLPDFQKNCLKDLFRMLTLLPNVRVAFRKVSQNWQSCLVICLKNILNQGVSWEETILFTETVSLLFIPIITFVRFYGPYFFCLYIRRRHDDVIDVTWHYDNVIISRRLLNNHMVLVGCAIDTELFSSVFLSKMKSLHCIEFKCFFC